MNTRRSSDAGFTLVEMMVAVSIFLIVMVVGVGSLIVMLSAANSAQAIQSISSNLSFAVDSISRDIRTGYTYHCTDDLAGPDDLLEPRDCLNGGSVLVFTDGETGDRTAYQFNQTSHRIEHPIFIESVSQPIWIAITSEDVYIENLRFFVEGSDDSDDVQPRVRVLVEGRAADQDIDAGTYFIQTTVTSKTLDL